MLQLALKSIRYNLSGHVSNKANFLFATLGMVINNTFMVYGLWLMLYQGKEQNQELLPYFISLNMTAHIGWGLICVLLGGLRVLGDLIDNGTLEPMLGTPRPPLLLAALSDSSPAAIGDIIMGFLLLGTMFFMFDTGFVLRSVLAIGFTFVAFIGVFIIAGSIAFYLSRGAALSWFIIESTLALSLYPTGKIFDGGGRWLLYLTPAFVTSVLPLEAVEEASPEKFLLAAICVSLFCLFSVWFFQNGLKRYRAANNIGLSR